MKSIIFLVILGFAILGESVPIATILPSITTPAPEEFSADDEVRYLPARKERSVGMTKEETVERTYYNKDGVMMFQEKSTHTKNDGGLFLMAPAFMDSFFDNKIKYMKAKKGLRKKKED